MPVLGIALAGVLLSLALAPRGMPPAQVDAAIKQAIEAIPPKPTAADAYEKIRPSVVLVTSQGDEAEDKTRPMTDDRDNTARGTGVIMVESGIILTNLHVVAGANSVRVTFETGLEADATVVSRHPENDLAVLQAKQVPDDLKAATIGAAKDLVEGEHVTAVGFPYGIGPSVSAGVVSGLRRQYASPDGERRLSNLIQFDAAANPGNSGGPLVNSAGEVVGIVTAILSPGERPGFSGIAFAVPIETAAGAAGLPPF